MAKILIVEDEDLLRHLFVDDFEFAGFEVYSAESGDSALEFLRNQSAKVDFILSDIRMPGGSGIELLRAVKADPKIDTNMALISGFADLDEAGALELGALKLFKKPFRSEELIEFVKSHL